jgi:thioredoxin 1
MLEITEENFEEVISRTEMPLVIEFGAVWCAPCKRLEPELERYAANWSGKMVLAHINVDENPDLATRFMVMGVPTVILLKNGELLERFSGFKPLQKMEDIFNKHM